MSYYYELLKLCGFEEKDIAEEKSRLERTFQKLELSPEDMKRAEGWVRQNHDIELLGVRKLLRAWLLELVDLTLAKEEGKKLVYYGFPSIQGPSMAIKAASQGEIYCACPDVILCHTLGQIFNKLTPVLEAGEANGLAPGHALCSLQQIRNGGMAKGIIPVPDLVTGSSYFCDMGSKADELLHEVYGHRAIYVDGSMDSKWGEYPQYLPERVQFLGAQLDKLFATVKEVLGVEVTRNAWDKAMATSQHLYQAIYELTQLMRAEPMPVSPVASGLALHLASGCTGRAMSDGPDAVDILCQEVQQRVDKGIGVVEKGAPRVMIFTTHFSDPGTVHMMEKAGLAVSATLVTVPPPEIPPSATYTTLGQEIADRELRRGSYHSSYSLVKLCEAAVTAFEIDGFIWNYIYNCRPMALTSHYLKKWLEEKTGVPTLSLEIDLFDSRNYSAAALETKVETFAEILRARKASQEPKR